MKKVTAGAICAALTVALLAGNVPAVSAKSDEMIDGYTCQSQMKTGSRDGIAAPRYVILQNFIASL